MAETTKLNIKTFLMNFRHWIDNEMENWEPEELDGGPIVDDGRELARFLAEYLYPKYNFDILCGNLDDLNEIVQSIATKYKEDDK